LDYSYGFQQIKFSTTTEPDWHSLPKDIPENNGRDIRDSAPAIGESVHKEGIHDRSDRESSTIEGTALAIDPVVC